MSTATWLSLVLAAASASGLFLAGRGQWQGWAVGLAIQPVWVAFAVVSHAYGLLATCALYAAVYARNLVRWRREGHLSAATTQDARDLLLFTQGWDSALEEVESYRRQDYSSREYSNAGVEDFLGEQREQRRAR